MELKNWGCNEKKSPAMARFFFGVTSSYFLSASSAKNLASLSWFSRASIRSSSDRLRFSSTLRILYVIVIIGNLGYQIPTVSIIFFFIMIFPNVVVADHDIRFGIISFFFFWYVHFFLDDNRDLQRNNYCEPTRALFIHSIPNFGQICATMTNWGNTLHFTIMYLDYFVFLRGFPTLLGLNSQFS